jgi:hypothetical protein
MIVFAAACGAQPTTVSNREPAPPRIHEREWTLDCVPTPFTLMNQPDDLIVCETGRRLRCYDLTGAVVEASPERMGYTTGLGDGPEPPSTDTRALRDSGTAIGLTDGTILVVAPTGRVSTFSAAGEALSTSRGSVTDGAPFRKTNGQIVPLPGRRFALHWSDDATYRVRVAHLDGAGEPVVDSAAVAHAPACR